MIVCPDCRYVNDEEKETCANCGWSLEPGPALLLPVRRDASERPSLELKTPEPPSKWRPVIVLGGFLIVVLGFAAWRLSKPDPCRGANFRSERFGYCLTVPEGWDAGTARVGSVALDQFTVPAQSTTVLVEAVDLVSGTKLDQFGEYVRQKDEQAGFTPEPVRATKVGGTDAEQWDITTSSSSGDTFQLREVVVVRGEIGWRITLNDSADGFGEDSKSFQQMLDSWRFA